MSQDGSLPGYESLTTILPTRNVGVFTAFTGDGGARAYAAKVLLNIFAVDLLLHGQPWFDQNSVCTIMDKMVDVTMASETRPTYLGRVSEPVGPSLSLISFNDGVSLRAGGSISCRRSPLTTGSVSGPVGPSLVADVL